MATPGSIAKRSDGRWTVKYKGRQTTCKTEAEAKRKLKQFKAEDGNMALDLSKMKVQDAVERWLEYHQCHVKPLTYDRIEQSWNNHVKKYVGKKQMGAVKEVDIEYMLSDMAKRGYSYSTIKKAYEVLSACFRYYSDRRMLSYNPAAVVRVPSINKKPKGEIVAYDDDELARIYKEATKVYSNGKPVYRYGWVFVLIGNTGLRGGEVFGLKKENIDLKKRLLYVRGNCVIAKDRDGTSGKKTKIVMQDKPKTAGSVRSIYLNDLALKAVSEIMNGCEESEYLLVSKNGELTTPAILDRSFRRILISAGFSKDKLYGIHALRHSFATGLIRRGIHAKIVSELLGHTDVRVTLQTYTHALQDDLKDAVVKLDTIGF